MAIKYLRRIAAFLMVFMMVFTLMPSAAFAEETNDSAGVETVVTADDTEETVNTKGEETTKEETTKENAEPNDSEVKDTSKDNDDVDKDTTTYEETTTSNNPAGNDDKDSTYEETTTSNDPAYDDKDAGSDDEDNTTEDKKEEKATSDETWDTGNQTSGSTEATVGDTDDTDIFDTGDEPEEEVKFDQQMTVDGVTVRVTADKGVFPQGSSLEVTKVPVSEEKKALEAVKEEGVDSKIAQSYTFDITIYDKDGNEIQPNTDKGKVKVSFTTDEVGRYDTSVYHMDGDEAEKLETKEKGETASAKTDGFSVYIVVFTYYLNDSSTTRKEYWGELTQLTGHLLDLKQILSANAYITLTSITSASCENPLVDVQKVYIENGDPNGTWMIQFKGDVSDAVLLVDGKEGESSTPKRYIIHLNVSLRRNVVEYGPTAYTDITYDGTLKSLLSFSAECRYSDDSTVTGFQNNMRYALADEFGEPPPLADSSKWTGNSTLLRAKDAGVYRVFYYASATLDGTYADSEMRSLKVTIKKKQVAVKSIKVKDKEYDGNANASVDCSNVVFVKPDDPNQVVEIAQTDKIGLTGVTGEFRRSDGTPDKNVGTKTVKLDYTNATLTGANAGNYELVVSDSQHISQQTSTASITAKPITVSKIKAVDKPYDGNVSTTIKPTRSGGTPELKGVINEDTVSFAIDRAQGEFDDENVGKNRTVTIVPKRKTAPLLTGGDAGNYVLDVDNCLLSASINPRPVEIQWNDSQGKESKPGDIIEYTYDGGKKQPAAKINKNDPVAGGEALDLKPVVIGGKVNASTETYYAEVTSLEGKNSKNFCLPDTNTRKEFKINPKEVAVDWSDTNLVYNGRKQLPTASVKGLLGSETCEVATIVTDRNPVYAGTYTATAANITNSNYKLAKDQKTTFTINKAPLTVKARDKSIRYGDKPANNGVTYQGFVPGEDQTKLGGQLKFRYSYKKNGKPGTYTITPYGYTSDNYDINYKDGKLKVKKVVTKLVGKVSSQGASKAKLSWNGISDADRYVLYFSECSRPFKKIATLGSWRRNLTRKGLKKGHTYKFKVVAQKRVRGSYKNLTKSKTAHVVIGNKNESYTNQKKLKVPKTTINLKPGKTYKIKAKYKKYFKDKGLLTSHASRLRYISSNKNVATVSKKGRIKAVKTGSCSIFVQTINGKWKIITVNVAK